MRWPWSKSEKTDEHPPESRHEGDRVRAARGRGGRSLLKRSGVLRPANRDRDPAAGELPADEAPAGVPDVALVDVAARDGEFDDRDHHAWSSQRGG